MSRYRTNPNLNKDLNSISVNLELIPSNTLSIKLNPQSRMFNFLTFQKPSIQDKAFKCNIIIYQAKAKIKLTPTKMKKICKFSNESSIKHSNNFMLISNKIINDLKFEYTNSPEVRKIFLNVEHSNTLQLTHSTFNSKAIINQKIKTDFHITISNPNYKENKVNPNKRKNNLNNYD